VREYAAGKRAYGLGMKERVRMNSQKQFRALERVHELLGDAMNIHDHAYPRIEYRTWFWSNKLVDKMAQLGHRIEEVWEVWA